MSGGVSRCAIVGSFPTEHARAVAEALARSAKAADKVPSFLFLASDPTAVQAFGDVGQISTRRINPDNLAPDDLSAMLGSEPFDAVAIWFEDLRPAPLLDLSEADWHAGLRVNAQATLLVAQYCIPLLAARQGSLVAVTSRAAREVLPGGGIFGVAKTLEANLIRSLACEAKELGVRANLVSPPPQLATGDAEALAHAIAFLTEPNAQAINGVTITVDGRTLGEGPTRAQFGIAGPKGELANAVRARRFRAIVTGGAGRIGTETVRALARLAREEGRDGLDVIVADLDAGRLDAVVADLVREGINAVSRQADLGDPDVPAALVRDAVANFGGLDFVHSNAGYGITDAALSATREQWEKIIGINLTATWRLALAAFPHLRQASGSLVATSSIASLAANARAPMYSASKAALNALVVQMAHEWGVQGVRVNLVCPGSIDTPMNQLSTLPPEQRAEIASGFPTPRLGDASEIAEVVSFLASRRASYISGHNLIVDGGLAQALR